MPLKQVATQNKPTSSTKKKAIAWDRDGIDGGDSSITIILDWLATGTNYQRWRGDLESGMTKTRLCSEILQIMKENGITHCDTKGVRQKIGDLQSSYNVACDWKKNTSEGILARDEVNGVKTVGAKILEMCRYWEELEPIMGSRSVTEPLHIRSSLIGDQTGGGSQVIGNQTSGGGPVIGNQPGAGSPEPVPAISTANARDPTGSADIQLNPALSFLAEDPLDEAHDNSVHNTPTATKKKPAKKWKSSTPGSSRSKASAKRSKKKNITSEELYIKSMVSTRQTEVTQAHAAASKVKVTYMKELRSHGLSLEEIKAKVAKEFPPLADMMNHEDSDSESESDDSS